MPCVLKYTQGLGLLAIVSALAALTMAATPPQLLLGGVELSLSSTAEAKGCIRLAIFDCPNAFAREESRFGEVLPLSGKESSIQFQLPPLPAGTYAIAVFHDLNNNGRLDKNLFGIPTEPYGFSREPTSKWQKPAWQDITTAIESQTTHLSILLKTWKERD